VSTTAHKDLAGVIRRLWKQAAYSSPAGADRLHKLYESDVLPVSRARIEAGVPDLPDFESLKPWLAKAIAKITEVGNNPVLVVNSDKAIEQQKLDFDRNDTWRVLIGGAKLSRGFTVEGLTVTYFRRATNMSDSLTQMGRWFGFRHGYRDLVRLYIDRNAQFGKRRFDLYEAFEAIAEDEAAFREQLTRYAQWDGDAPLVLPSQIPPLVSQHLPWLQPTAGNKMFNAALTEQSDQVLSPTGHPNHVDLIHANLERWRPLLARVKNRRSFPAAGQKALEAYTGLVDASEFVDLVDELDWMPYYRQRFVAPRTTYYRRLLEESATKLEDLLIVLPQPNVALESIAGVGARMVISRDRRSRGGSGASLFGEITDPKHRRFLDPMLRETAPPAAHTLADLWRPNRGVVLTYLLRESEPDYETTPTPVLGANDPERGLIVGFALFLPDRAVGTDRVLRFTVVNTADPLAASVDV
jgi:hypothetical protein